MNNRSPAKVLGRHSMSCRLHDFEVASTRISSLAGRSLLFAALFAAGGANAQSLEFSPSLRLTGFADTPTQGDISSDTLFSGRVDAFLKVKNISPGGTVKGQLEFVDGDDAIGLGVAAVIWPTNSYSAVPRLLNSDKPEWSLWLTHELNESHSLSVSKWNVFELADQTSILGGQGKGGGNTSVSLPR